MHGNKTLFLFFHKKKEQRTQSYSVKPGIVKWNFFNFQESLVIFLAYNNSRGWIHDNTIFVPRCPWNWLARNHTMKTNILTLLADSMKPMKLSNLMALCDEKMRKISGMRIKIPIVWNRVEFWCRESILMLSVSIQIGFIFWNQCRKWRQASSRCRSGCRHGSWSCRHESNRSW